MAIPFRKELDDLYRYAIFKPLTEHGYSVVRMDEQAFTGDVIEVLKEKIATAEFVIAEISDENPNVYLEIGYAWGMQKQTFLVSRPDKKPPFNVRGHKIIRYNSFYDLESAISAELAAIDAHIGKYTSSIRIEYGDITELACDAIVNAGNEHLLPGNGVSGAIHKKAGPELESACLALQVTNGLRCPTGDARITPGFGLKAKFVIHTVGPVFHDGNSGERELLASCYKACLQIAKQNKIHCIAFPAISTGVYRFPKAAAAQVAVNEVVSWIDREEFPRQVIFCCFEQADKSYYDALLKPLS